MLTKEQADAAARAMALRPASHEEAKRGVARHIARQRMLGIGLLVGLGASWLFDGDLIVGAAMGVGLGGLFESLRDKRTRRAYAVVALIFAAIAWVVWILSRTKS